MEHLRQKSLPHRAIAPESIKSIEDGGTPDSLFMSLEEAGISASKQIELARRSLKELEDSIRTIAWTKEETFELFQAHRGEKVLESQIVAC
jgi:hypothetical protein